jgi:DNA repair exonuclease SbcCD ATPase subunit
MDDREAARRELETKLLELVAEYQRVLRNHFLAVREGARWRYRYAQEARQDLEEATARAANLRERLGELREETERRRGREEVPAEDNLEVERAAAAEDLARAEGLARAAEALLSRPEFAFRDRAHFEERVSGLVRTAVEEAEKLRRALGEAIEHGERELHEAAQETVPES